MSGEVSSASNDALEKWGTQTMAWAEDDMAIVAEMAAELGLKLPQSDHPRNLPESQAAALPARQIRSVKTVVALL